MTKKQELIEEKKETLLSDRLQPGLCKILLSCNLMLILIRKDLRLVVEDAEEGDICDHASWAGAKVY